VWLTAISSSGGGGSIPAAFAPIARTEPPIGSRERGVEPWVGVGILRLVRSVLVCFVSVWRGVFPFWCDLGKGGEEEEKQRRWFRKGGGGFEAWEWEGSDGWDGLRMWIRRLRSE
jgi:hypothetical protein